MTIISIEEFITHQEKYFDMALEDPVIIKRGEQMFIIQKYIPNHDPDEIFEPDDDLCSSITADELLEGIDEDIDTFFASK